MQTFKIIGKSLLGEKHVEGKKKKGRRRIMPSLVATTSALAHTHNVCAHALQSDQNQFICSAPFQIETKSGKGLISRFISHCYFCCMLFPKHPNVINVVWQIQSEQFQAYCTVCTYKQTAQSISI